MGADSNLRRALRLLAARFLDDVIAIALGAHGAAAASAKSPRPKRVRRGVQALRELEQAVLTTLEQKDGQAVRDIAWAIGVTSRELSRPLALLVANGKIRKSGDRRTTRYFVGNPKPARTKLEATSRTKPRASGAAKKRTGKARSRRG